MGAILWAITMVLILIYIYINHHSKSAIYRGEEGEKIVRELLDNIRGSKAIINNVLFSDNGKSRQIDHIAITEYGIFVIETKNRSGKIYGEERSNKWKQYINKYCKYDFENPIHQNYGHLLVVCNILKDINKMNVHSLIVFTNKCILKTKTVTPVLYVQSLITYIEGCHKVFNKEDIQSIKRQIMDNVIVDEDMIKYHNKNVKEYVEYKQKLARLNICSRCGGDLIKKKGKYGFFYGCINYPKCRYTKNIE